MENNVKITNNTVNTIAQEEIIMRKELANVVSEVYKIVSMQTKYFNGNVIGTRNLVSELKNFPFDSENDRFKAYCSFVETYGDLCHHILNYEYSGECNERNIRFEVLYSVINGLLGDGFNDIKVIDKLNNKDNAKSKFDYVGMLLNRVVMDLEQIGFEMIYEGKVTPVDPSSVCCGPLHFVEICN